MINTKEELFEKFPELKIIIDQLDESVTDCNAANENYEENKRNGSAKPSDTRLNPDEAQLTRTYSEAERDWTDSRFKRGPGGQKLLEYILSCAKIQKPDAFEVCTWKGLRKSDGRKTKFWINDSAKTTKAEDDDEENDDLGSDNTATGNKKSDSKKEMNQKIFKKFEDIEKRLEENGGKLTDNQELRKEMAEMKHQMQIDALKAAHDLEISDLEWQLEEKDNTILDLNESLSQYQAELGSANTELEKKRESPAFVQILGDVAAKGLVGFLKSYPVVTEHMTGLNAENQKKMWIEAEKQLNLESTQNSSGTETSFSESNGSGIDFTGVSKEQQDGILILIEFMKAVDWTSFQKIYFFFNMITVTVGNGETAELSIEYLDEIYAFLHNLKKIRETKKAEPVVTNEEENQ